MSIRLWNRLSKILLSSSNCDGGDDDDDWDLDDDDDRQNSVMVNSDDKQDARQRDEYSATWLTQLEAKLFQFLAAPYMDAAENSLSAILFSCYL